MQYNKEPFPALTFAIAHRSSPSTLLGRFHCPLQIRLLDLKLLESPLERSEVRRGSVGQRRWSGSESRGRRRLTFLEL